MYSDTGMAGTILSFNVVTTLDSVVTFVLLKSWNKQAEGKLGIKCPLV